MLEKVAHIKNPLTVIAIFAALAEVSGTVVLPFLEKDLQEIYVWFLMAFPVLLVLAFFLTLNFNRRALYAPSDYREEQHFVDLAAAASPEAREEKLKIEVAQLRRMEERQAQPTKSTIPFALPYGLSPAVYSPDESRRSKVSLSEVLALNLISQELNKPVSYGIKLTGRYSSQAILFDGVIEDGDTLRAIEVKYFPNRRFQTAEIKKFFSEVERLHLDIADLQHKTLALIFIVVTDENEEGQERIRNRLNVTASRFSMQIEIKVYGAVGLVKNVETKLGA